MSLRRSLTPPIVIGALALVAGCAKGGKAVPQPFPTVEPPAAPRSAAPADGRLGPALVDAALALRGSPYRDGGADRAGFDCSGLVTYVYRQHGLVVPHNVVALARLGTVVDREKVAAGDLVFFQTVARGPSHVGIAIDRERFIHAPSSGGHVRIERLDLRYWRTRYLGAKRILASAAVPAPDARSAVPTPAPAPRLR